MMVGEMIVDPSAEDESSSASGIGGKVKLEGCGGRVVGLLRVSGLLPTELRELPRVAAFCKLQVVLPEDDDIA